MWSHKDFFQYTCSLTIPDSTSTYWLWEFPGGGAICPGETRLAMCFTRSDSDRKHICTFDFSKYTKSVTHGHDLCEGLALATAF